MLCVYERFGDVLNAFTLTKPGTVQRGTESARVSGPVLASVYTAVHVYASSCIARQRNIRKELNSLYMYIDVTNRAVPCRAGPLFHANVNAVLV